MLSRPTLTRARDLYLAGQIPDVENIPCACGAPRDAHAGRTHAGGNPATGCVRYREDQLAGIVARAHHAREHGFADSMAAYDRMTRKKAPKKRGISVRPSDLGGCRRAVWYRETPPEGYEPAPTDRRAAWVGGLIHDELARRRAALYPWRMYETALKLPGSDRDYRLDEYDPVTATLYEIKTAGDWRWEQVGQEGPDEKWLAQAMVYAWALRRAGYPVDTVVLLVLQREGGQEETFPYTYDEATARKALRWIADLAIRIEAGIEQPRDEPGPSTSKMCSKLCPARNHCWNIPQAESLGRSPENLTLLGLTPHEEQIIEHLETLDALRRARLKAKEEEDAVKALVDGIELREYGDFYPKPGGTSTTDWKGWKAQVTEWWNKPADERPAQLPEPAEKKSRYYTWTRIRKSERDKRAKAKAAALAASAAALDAPPEAPQEPLAEAS